MSSTEHDELERITRERLSAFFRERLVPLARRLHHRGVRFFPLEPEPEQASWFVPYRATPNEELDAGEPDAERLRALWAEHPELAALADELFALAVEIHPTQTERAEVSPCFYVMF